jgi:hypothetical protein
MVSVGEVVKAESKAGNPVERMCVAIIAPKEMKAIEQTRAKNGFAAVFVKDNITWLGLTKAQKGGKPMSKEEIKERETFNATAKVKRKSIRSKIHELEVENGKLGRKGDTAGIVKNCEKIDALDKELKTLKRKPIPKHE